MTHKRAQVSVKSAAILFSRKRLLNVTSQQFVHTHFNTHTLTHFTHSLTMTNLADYNERPVFFLSLLFPIIFSNGCVCGNREKYIFPLIQLVVELFDFLHTLTHTQILIFFFLNCQHTHAQT